jgi:hypothetical protein
MELRWFEVTFIVSLSLSPVPVPVLRNFNIFFGFSFFKHYATYKFKVIFLHTTKAYGELEM